MVERAIDTCGAPVYVRKEIVHNQHVVSELEKRGAIFVDQESEIPEGAVCIFSAHGVSPQVRRNAEARNLQVIDATCPLVTKVHLEAKKFARGGRDIVLVGHRGHEEIEGTAGEVPDRTHVIESVEQIEHLDLQPDQPIAYLTQTTLSVDDTLEVVEGLRGRFTNINGPHSDDICYATQNRQQAVKAIAKTADLVLVVGSGNSSNSVRLVEVALESGAKTSYRVDDASEIRAEWLEGVTSVGVTSGASVPEDLVEGVLDFLAARGFPTATAVHTAEESLIFALPPELRRDLRDAGVS